MMRSVFPKLKYYVHTGKVYKTKGGWRNFQVCYSLKHALAVYKKCKVDARQIDVKIRGEQPYVLKWGR